MNTTVIPSSLLVNQLREPFGVVSPSFSWKMSSGRQGARQTAYRRRVSVIRAGVAEEVWDSGEVESAEQVALH